MQRSGKGRTPRFLRNPFLAAHRQRVRQRARSRSNHDRATAGTYSLMSWPLGAAIGTLGRDKVLMVRVEHQFADRLLVVPLAHLSTLRFVEQCQSTASRFLGQCQHTNWIGLCWASLRRPVGTYGDMCSGLRVEATPLAKAKVLPLALSTLSFGFSGTATDAALF